jgi:hypothetical protein
MPRKFRERNLYIAVYEYFRGTLTACPASSSSRPPFLLHRARVPELIRDGDIKPNEWVSLRPIVVALSCSHRSLSLEVIYE